MDCHRSLWSLQTIWGLPLHPQSHPASRHINPESSKPVFLFPMDGSTWYFFCLTFSSSYFSSSSPSHLLLKTPFKDHTFQKASSPSSTFLAEVPGSLDTFFFYVQQIPDFEADCSYSRALLYTIFFKLLHL